MDNEISISPQLIIKEITEQTKTKLADTTPHNYFVEARTDLPRPQKEALESNRQQTSEIQEIIISGTEIIVNTITTDQQRLNYLSSKGNPTKDNQEETEILKQRIEKTTNGVEIIRDGTRKMFDNTNRIIDEHKKDMFKNFIDEKTGLYSLNVVIENTSKEIDQWLIDGETHPNNIKVIMTDMLLFHTANHNLGPIGLDNKLFDCMQGQIAISRFLANEHSLYSPFSESEIKNNRYLQQYFPENSEAREKLEKLKQADVQISPCRVHPGAGDEFAYYIKLDSEHDGVYENLAEEVINHVVESTSIEVSQEINLEDRKEKYKAFYNSLNHLKFKDRSDRETPLTSEQATLNHFIDSFRLYFLNQENIGFGKEITKSDYNLSMGHATIKFGGDKIPTAEDALLLFLYGKDKYQTKYKKNEFGFVTENNQLDTLKIDNYATKLNNNIREMMLPQDAGNPEKLQELIKELLINDTVKNFYDILNEEVNNIGKRRKKKDIYLNAISGDVKSMLIVGASEQSGRDFYIPKDKIKTIKSIQKYYKSLAENEKQKSTSEQNKALIELMELY